jgi:hypothetical protein
LMRLVAAHTFPMPIPLMINRIWKCSSKRP